jgi:hypothetical protein
MVGSGILALSLSLAPPLAEAEQIPPMGVGLAAGGGVVAGFGGVVIGQSLIWRHYHYRDAAKASAILGGGMMIGAATMTLIGGLQYRRHRRFALARMGVAPRRAAGLPLVAVGGAALGVGTGLLIRAPGANLAAEPSQRPAWAAGVATGGTLLLAGLGTVIVGSAIAMRHEKRIRAHQLQVGVGKTPGGAGGFVAGRF